MAIKLLLVLIIGIISSAYANSAVCEYGSDNRYDYFCKLKFSDPDEESSTFTAIDGQHKDGKSNGDVLAVWVENALRSSDFPALLCQQFPNVIKIYIRHLNVAELSENSFSSCSNLQYLTIKSDDNAGAFVTKLPQNLISKNDKLKSFIVRLVKLQSLPQNFFVNNQNIDKVSLGVNAISSLPDDIFQPLVNLQDLILSKNSLTHINPAWFSTLTKLKVLFLNGNQITDIPSGAFSNLGELSQLWLSNNQISVINSDSFGVLPHLTELDLSGNQIEAIDEKLIDNAAVQVILANDNKCVDGVISNKSGAKDYFKEKLTDCTKNYHGRN